MNSWFRQNEGAVDRVIRVVVGLAVLSLTFIGPQTMWGLVGLLPIVTGAVGYCPLYALLGVSTCPVKKQTIAMQS